MQKHRKNGNNEEQTQLVKKDRNAERNIPRKTKGQTTCMKRKDKLTHANNQQNNKSLKTHEGRAKDRTTPQKSTDITKKDSRERQK